jgi:mannose-6-phosphate isomerase-like protein (cupin superfamily)
MSGRHNSENRRKYMAAYRKRPESIIRNRGHSRTSSRKRLYGIDRALFAELLSKQDFRCSICRDPINNLNGGYRRDNKPCVDHNHITGEIRGLICHHCNCMLGFSRDNALRLEMAAHYLRGHTGKVQKVWGTTECLISTPLFELHRLEIKPGHRCSLHAHRTKWNLFYILEGSLSIDLVLGDIDAPIEEKKLQVGGSISVPPGVHHQFRTNSKSCVCLEVYYTEPLSEDIIRRNIGGPV